MKKLKLLFVVISVVLFLDLALNVFDVWGLYYFDNLDQIWNNSVKSEASNYYYLPKGQYTFKHWLFDSWKATQIADGQRYVPASKGYCDVVFLGDSMTWGHGVNDNQTWVNIIASKMPQINAINTGEDGYTSENVIEAMQAHFGASLYIYFIIPNDTEKAHSKFEVSYTNMSMIERYFRLFGIQFSPNKQQFNSNVNDDSVKRFQNDVKYLEQNNVLMFGLDASGDDIKPLVKDRNIAGWVSYPKSTYLSVVDHHPNAEGHKILAEQIYVIIKDKVERACNEQTKK